MTRMRGEVGDWLWLAIERGRFLHPLLIPLVSCQSLLSTHGCVMTWLMVLDRGHCYKEVCGGSSGLGFILCLCK